MRPFIDNLQAEIYIRKLETVVHQYGETHAPPAGFFNHLGLFLTLTSNVYAEGSGIYVGGIAGASLRSDTSSQARVWGPR